MSSMDIDKWFSGIEYLCAAYEGVEPAREQEFIVTDPEGYKNKLRKWLEKYPFGEEYGRFDIDVIYSFILDEPEISCNDIRDEILRNIQVNDPGLYPDLPLLAPDGAENGEFVKQIMLIHTCHQGKTRSDYPGVLLSLLNELKKLLEDEFDWLTKEEIGSIVKSVKVCDKGSLDELLHEVTNVMKTHDSKDPLSDEAATGEHTSPTPDEVKHILSIKEPKRKNEWFSDIKKAAYAFAVKHRRAPSAEELWDALKEILPTGWSEAFGAYGQELSAPGKVKPLVLKRFKERHKRYFPKEKTQ